MAVPDTRNESGGVEPPARRLSRFLTPAAVLVCVALLAWLQFSFRGMPDGDSYFHTRAARELARHGFQRHFPQAAFSTWTDRYADKDLLFHALLIPFQFAVPGSASAAGAEDLVTPGKVAIVALALLFLAALAFALRSTGAMLPWLWVLLLFFMDLAVLRGFLAVRPGILGAAFVLVEIVFLLRKEPGRLAIAGALHTYAHSSFALLPGLALAVAAAHWLRREKFPVRLLGAALAGPVAASILNPYFPNNLRVAWDQLVEVALGVWWQHAAVPVELFGSELTGALTSNLLSSFAAFLPAVGAMVVFLADPRRRVSTEGLSLLMVCGFLLVPSFLSARFLQFFFPATVLLGARLWSELLGGGTLREARRRDPRTFRLAAGLVLVSLAGGLAHGTVFKLHGEVVSMATAEVQRPAIEFLKKTAAPGDLVYHNFWWDFSALYHFRPEGRYVVALDPVFFYRGDPVRFRKSLEAYRGELKDLYRVLKDDFGARWVYIAKGPRNRPLFDLMVADGHFEKAYEDDFVVIARLP